MDRATNQTDDSICELRLTRVWGAEVASLGGSCQPPTTMTFSDPAQIFVEHS